MGNLRLRRSENAYEVLHYRGLFANPMHQRYGGAQGLMLDRMIGNTVGMYLLDRGRNQRNSETGSNHLKKPFIGIGFGAGDNLRWRHVSHTSSLA